MRFLETSSMCHICFVSLAKQDSVSNQLLAFLICLPTLGLLKEPVLQNNQIHAHTQVDIIIFISYMRKLRPTQRQLGVQDHTPISNGRGQTPALQTPSVGLLGKMHEALNSLFPRLYSFQCQRHDFCTLTIYYY